MANPVKGEVPLTLGDGRTFTLALDMEALVEAEAAYGKPLHQLMADASAGFMGAMGAMLQGALSAHHRVTRKEALAMLRTDMQTIADALGKATDAAFPKDEPKAGNGSPKPARRGKSSGRSGAKRG